MLYDRGSQWLYVVSGDPALPTITYGKGYVAVHGDATQVYNSAYEGSTDVTHATRSAVWLEPDAVVIYDHAQTTQPGFKRFWLNLTAPASISGNRTSVITPKGQQFWIYTLLPTDAVRSVTPVADEPSGPPANCDLVRFRFRAEAANNPTNAYFLHVLIGADSGAQPPPVELISSDPSAPSVRIGNQTVHFSGDMIQVTNQPN